MNRKIAITTVSSVGIVMLVLISGCTQQTSETNTNNQNQASGYYLYEDPQERFSIDYPVTWDIREDISTQFNLDACFLSQSQEPTQIGTVMISIQQLEDYVDMMYFLTAHIENLSIDEGLPNFTIVSEHNTTLAGEDAHELIFTYQYEIYTWKQREIWTIKNSMLYLVAFQCDQERYEGFVEDVNHMVESFEIT